MIKVDRRKLYDMNYKELIKLQKCTREWINSIDFKNPYAATLTFKKSIIMEGSLYMDRMYLNEAEAAKTIKLFINILNEKIFGKAAKRHRRRCQCISISEGTDTKHLHYHLVIDCPRDELKDQFPDMIEEAWSKIDWAGEQTDVQIMYNKGWIDYITKLRDKRCFTGSIDVDNCHFH